MNGRERILCTMSGQEPDRVPIDIGGLSNLTSLHKDAYQELLDALGIREELVLSSYQHQSVALSPRIRTKFHVDTYPIFLPFVPLDEQEMEDGSRLYRDEWGICWKKPFGGFYYDRISNPLADFSIDQLKEFHVPESFSNKQLVAIKSDVFEAHEKMGLFTILNTPNSGTIFTLAQRLMGYENFFIAMVEEPERVKAITQLALQYQKDFLCRALDQLEGLVDGVLISDDVATQNGPMISFDMYREFVLPLQKQIVALVRERSSAKRLFHCCGAAAEFIPLMMEAGFQAWNPVQVSAHGNEDTNLLKRRWGKGFTFWGGVCDNVDVLVNGTPYQVKEEVRRRIYDLAPGGGFVAAPIHNIQRDVPVANILALFDAMYEFGSEVYR